MSKNADDRATMRRFVEAVELLAISVLVHVNLGDPGDTSGSGRRVGTSLLTPAVPPSPMSYRKRFECLLNRGREFSEKSCSAT